MSVCVFFFFFKQKTAYEIVSRDWSSDVCSSDLHYDSLSSLCGSDVPKNSSVYYATVFVDDCVRSLQFDPHKYSGM